MPNRGRNSLRTLAVAWSCPGLLDGLRGTAYRHRMSGAFDNDQEARSLCQAVGAVVVAGGHVEFRMQRLLAAIRGHKYPDLGTTKELSWSQLAEALGKEAHESNHKEVLLSLMKREAGINTLRNNVVHAVWRLDMGPPTAMRMFRGGSAATLVGSMSDLRAEAQSIFGFADALEALAVEHGQTPFPIARPPLE